MSWIGLDIGGANLKAADGHGWARSVPFQLWREPERLAGALRELVAAAPARERWAVTMTGELCDCFRTKAAGVRHILAAVASAAGGRDVCVYCVDGRFVSVDEACERPQSAAAGNWHALALFACRYVDGRAGVLIDIGSTTTDIIRLVDGRPSPRGMSDTERLVTSELLYTGVGRTPICAVTRWLPWRGGRCPVAAELFATTADAYVILGDLPEQRDATWTADGRPLTVEFSRDRLARMVCADGNALDMEDARLFAEYVRDAQVGQLRDALAMVLSSAAPPLAPPHEGDGDMRPAFVISGAGEFLAHRVVNADFSGADVVSLSDPLGWEVSACAPAHALAVLARETESP